ncbi:translation initiation factor IF-2 [Salinibius halmophilus]|uniref:translation initiation factor IF-2 n=1 Tax=Salinibius halmophilus TaxID=1853216 RepID=UPI000E66548F|nr:translation initiation factor IF-2 [Salinibius halmophilus]
MAQVSVKELAASIGTPVDRLLTQMSDAGLPQKAESDAVSDEQKETLLAHLKKAHGDEAGAAPKKITLKRKKSTQLSTGKSKVNVEVRKKRTYVKRETPAVEAAETEAPVDTPNTSEQPVEQPVAEAKAEAKPAAKAAEKAPAKPALDKPSIDKPAMPKAKAAKKPVVSAGGSAVAGVKVAKKKSKEEELPTARAANASPIASVKATKKVADEPVAEKPAPAEKKKENRRPKPAATAPVQNAPADGPAPEKANTKKRSQSRNDENRGRDDERGKKAAGKTKLKGAGKHGTRKQQVMGYMDEDGGMRGRRKKKGADKSRDHQFEKPTAPVIREVELGESITVQDLASQMSIKGAEVIKSLFKMGVMATINQILDQDTAILVIEELGHKYKIIDENETETALTDQLVYEGEAKPRAPVVTVMGHVDHGKTSLLDHIRETRVTSGEHGGITQHIGAYHVETPRGMVSFLDTPGHAAFTEMRARGAQCTDVVILVVAADDGVMPQTEEAIQHAKAAGVPIVVAINKMDKPSADPDRVINELAQRDVVPEDWGGDTQMIKVSAHSGLGIDELLEAVLLQAELLDLQAHDEGPARGVVVEASLDKGRGSVATVLVQEGQLKQGDVVLAGTSYGRVRALLDENRKPVKSAGPSIPVEILGLDGSPNAGDDFMVVENDRQAREAAEERRQKAKETEVARQQAAKLENMMANMGSAEAANLNVVLKTDVRGSLEAISAALLKLSTDEVKVNIVGAGVGAISESDANLAITANAVIFGFNTRASGKSREVIEQNGIDLRYYNVIYNLIDDVKAAMSGMLSPELREEIVGLAEVRDVFNSPKFGQVAGCMVIEGTMYRNKKIRVLRDDVVIYEGELESLRRFKDDVQEVRQGMECGIGVKNYNDVKAGDKIEVFDVKEIARSIDD